MDGLSKKYAHKSLGNDNERQRQSKLRYRCKIIIKIWCIEILKASDFAYHNPISATLWVHICYLDWRNQALKLIIGYLRTQNDKNNIFQNLTLSSKNSNVNISEEDSSMSWIPMNAIKINENWRLIWHPLPSVS